MPARAVLTLLLATFATTAVAQQENWAFPNPLQGENTAATCQNWPAQQQSADPQAMQYLVGVWESMSMIPGTPGITPDTPIQIRSQNSPDGTFVADRYGCFEMQSVAGMPSLGQSCATSQIYGQWVAHFTQGGDIAVVTLSAGSSFTGQALPMSCGIAFFRPTGDGNLMDQQGNQLRRVNY
jgi:hypothetical protein